MKSKLIIGILALLLSLGGTCQANESNALATARSSVVRLVIKIDDFDKISEDQKKALTDLAKDTNENNLIRGFIKSLIGGTPVAVATGIVVAKDEDAGYTHVATTYPINKALAEILYIEGPQGLERVDRNFGSDKERGLYFLKTKSLREKLEPISMHADALSLYQSDKSLGSKIWLISFPVTAQLDNMTDREPTTQYGTVAALSKRNQDGTPVIQTGFTAHISSSGGAVVNEKGELIAIAGLDFQLNNNGVFETLELASKKTTGTVFGVPANFIKDYLVTYKIKTKAPTVASTMESAPASAPVDAQASLFKQDSISKGLSAEVWAAIGVGVLALIALAFALTKSKTNSNKFQKMQLRYAGADSSLRTQGPWLIDETGITVGREAQIRLNSEKSSSIHARFLIKQGKACVEHLSQTNSTLVNNQQVSGSQTLTVGDRIQISKGGTDIFILENVS